MVQFICRTTIIVTCRYLIDTGESVAPGFLVSGVCAETLLVWQKNTRIRYRHSIPSVASFPESVRWSRDLFTRTLDYLPGIPNTHPHFGYVTYPRFVPIGNNLLLTLRNGKAGLGDDLLYLYHPSLSADTETRQVGTYSFMGTLIHGVENNPYIHGLTFRDDKLHVTWVWRGFVPYPGWDDPFDTKHKMQAGPNGAENNYDICYSYSDDGGQTWRNGNNIVVADLSLGQSVTPSSPDIVAFQIPKGSSLTNQESQTVDKEGRVFVLNRDGLDGQVTWNLYMRSTDGKTTPTLKYNLYCTPLTIYIFRKRKSLVVAR